MISPQKKFSLKDYEKNGQAFEALKKHFGFLFPILREEDYGIDVALYNGETAYRKDARPLAYIELESKSIWTEYDFPTNFNDVQFLAKKQKFCTNEIPTYWVLFNSDCTNCAIVPFRKIIICELDIIKCTKMGIKQDYVYRIPKDKMCWGINNTEKFIIQDSFDALYHENQRF